MQAVDLVCVCARARARVCVRPALTMLHNVTLSLIYILEIYINLYINHRNQGVP